MIKVQANEGGKQSHMDAGAVRFYCYAPGLIQGSTTAMLYYAPTPVAPGVTIPPPQPPRSNSILKKMSREV